MIRPLIFIMVLLYLITLGYYIHKFPYEPNEGATIIYVPWTLILISISLYIFYEDNRVRAAKRENRRTNINHRRQELLDNVLKSKKKDDETNVK